MAGGGHGTKAIIAALVANMGIAVAKFAGFIITGSSSLLAESVHSVADSGNQGLLLLGGKRAAREPTAMHPFGFGRERYFWSFVVAIILFTLGSLFAIYEAVEKILHPHELESPAVAIGILAVACVLEAFSFRTAIVESRPHKGNASWMTFIRRSKSPELPVVLLEDAGAMAGLVIALCAVVLTMTTGNPVYDGYGTLIIGLLLGAIAILLAFEMKSLLIGEAADPAQEERIKAAIAGSPEVRSLIWLRTQHLGPEDLLVAAKVEFSPELRTTELARVIDDVEARIRDQIPAAHHLFIEPDVRRAAAAMEAAPDPHP